jgi:hypothetical protein
MNRFDEMLNRFEGLLNRFEGAEGAPTASTTASDAGSASAPAKKERVHKAIKEFDELMTDPLNRFKEASKKLENKNIEAMTDNCVEVFHLMRSIILAITKSKTDKTENMAPIIAPFVKDFDKKIGKARDPKIKNHQKALLDGLQLIQLTIMHDPHDYGKEFLAQIDFFGNKVLMERKDLDTQW